MKKIILLTLLFVSSIGLNAQTKNNKEASANFQGLKIVFQLTSADTLIHQNLMNQLKNYWSVAPDTQFEVVCHSAGLNMLLKNTCVIQDDIKMYADKGVSFVACEFSMKKKNVTKDQLVAGSSTVTSGVLEIAKKQQEGWSYIKL
ncbi:DsrE family protein [Daejeonella sp.]|jgi:intracellular sulfur oxidation DsrE/DsrF family protein|uniref:DsrE family protein n=1 Tax=Daejeonella sp. TaxID=2805397 RepID=UPI003782F9CD